MKADILNYDILYLFLIQLSYQFIPQSIPSTYMYVHKAHSLRMCCFLNVSDVPKIHTSVCSFFSYTTNNVSSHFAYDKFHRVPDWFFIFFLLITQSTLATC